MNDAEKILVWCDNPPSSFTTPLFKKMARNLNEGTNAQAVIAAILAATKHLEPRGE